MIDLRIIFLALILPALAGCGMRAGTKESASRDTTVQTFAQKVPEPASEPARAANGEHRLPVARDENHSNNATKNDVGAIGVQVVKLAEKMQAFGGDFLRIHSTLRADAEVQAKVNAELTAKVEALVQAQAGIGNKIEQQTVAISSGRDTTQFTVEMQKMIETKDRTIYWIVGTSVGALVTIVGTFVKMLGDKEASRERADKRAASANETLLKGLMNAKV